MPPFYEALSRLAIIYHTSPRITFGGDWIGASANERGLRSRTGTFSFSFEGTDFWVFTGQPWESYTRCTYSCTIDGIDYRNTTSCLHSPEPLPAGKHTVNVTVEATVDDPNFSLIDVRYSPSSLEDVGFFAEEDFGDGRVRIDARDRNFTFGEEWNRDSSKDQLTTTQLGSTVNLTFYGTGIRADVGNFKAADSPLGYTYTLDDGPPMNRNLATGNGMTFIQEHELCLSTHTLSIQYTRGDPGLHAFTVRDVFYVFRTPKGAQPTPRCLALSDSHNNAPLSGSKPNTGAIAGSVVGGVVALAGFLLIAFWLRRRRGYTGHIGRDHHRRSLAQLSPNTPTQPGTEALTPFMSQRSPPMPHETKGKAAASSARLSIIGSLWSSSSSSVAGTLPRQSMEPVQHLDSGIRVPPELPPVYSAN